MPHITQEQREDFKKLFGVEFLEFKPTPGELNYLVTKLLLETKPKCYRDFNDLVGVLECCKLEFYRLAVAAYEDEKRKENGDVYQRNS